MSSAAQSQELDALPVASEPARTTRGVFVSFATLVVVGLGLAGRYVSTRIMAAEPQPAAPVPQTVQSVAPATPAIRPAAPPPAPEALLPLALEYYLQIAALGTAQDAVYLKQLREKGYQAQFEAAAPNRDARILIGPY